MIDLTTRPSDIAVDRGAGELRITWGDGQVSRYPLQWLRANCPCATCREERREATMEQAASAVAFWREGPNAENVMEARSDIALVYQLLTKMSRKKREVFILREVEQLSGEEVAQILGIPTATVRTRLFHARKEFTRLLEKAGAAEKLGGTQ